MRAIFASTKPQQPRHRRHRHKKFHVAPEALGLGYEDYDVAERPNAPAPPLPAAPPPMPQAQALATIQALAPGVTSEWAKLSERETTSRAAWNALQFWFWFVASLILIGCVLAYRGWGWRLVEWMYQFPAPTH